MIILIKKVLVLMMWLMIRNIYLKFEEEPLRNKEVIQKTFFHENFKWGISDNLGARAVNLVTYDMANDQKHIFEDLSK
jgi:hypothetical protein